MGNLSHAVKNLPIDFRAGDNIHFLALERVNTSLREVIGGQIRILLSNIIPDINQMVKELSPTVISVLEEPPVVTIADPSNQKTATRIAMGFSRIDRLRNVPTFCPIGRVTMKLEDSIVNLEKTCIAANLGQKTQEDVMRALLSFQCKLAEKIQHLVIFIL